MAASSGSPGSDTGKVMQSVISGAVRKRFRVYGDKHCTICGDKALAHHFGVLACESCKAFFRRNALRKNELKPCGVRNSCQMNKDSRRSCPCCRLNKCFDVGMKPELIFDESQKKELMEKVRKSKLQRQAQQPMTCSEQAEELSPVVSSTAPNTSPVPVTPTTKQENGQRNCCPPQCVNRSNSGHQCILGDSAIVRPHHFVDGGVSRNSSPSKSQQVMVAPKELCSLKSGSQQSHRLDSDHSVGEMPMPMVNSSSSVTCQSMVSSCDILSSNCSSQMSWEGQRRPSSIDLGTLTRDELPSDPHMYRRLPEDERMLLSQLSCAYEDTLLESLRHHRSSSKLDSNSYSLSDSLSDYEEMVHHATDFAKRLEDFQRLDFDDRIACFKASIDSFVAVYNSYVYIPERNSWLMIKGEVSYDLFMTVYPDYPFMRWRTEQCRELKSIAKNDVTVYSLLHCILLFNPSGEKISDRQLVSALREKYMILLRHYCEATFSFAYSESYFKAMQNKIVEIQDLIQAERKFAADTNCHLTEEFLSFKLLQELHTADK